MGRRSIEVAKKLRENGVLVTLVSRGMGSGSYDPSTGGVATDDPVLSTRAAMLMDQLTHTHNSRFGQRNMPNTLIEGVDKWMLMDAMGIKPRVQDKVEVNEKEYEIINVQTTEDRDGDVLHTLALKQ